jgi:hypothetical protein
MNFHRFCLDVVLIAPCSEQLRSNRFWTYVWGTLGVSLTNQNQPPSDAAFPAAVQICHRMTISSSPLLSGSSKESERERWFKDGKSGMVSRSPCVYKSCFCFRVHKAFLANFITWLLKITVWCVWWWNECFFTLLRMDSIQAIVINCPQRRPALVFPPKSPHYHPPRFLTSGETIDCEVRVKLSGLVAVPTAPHPFRRGRSNTVYFRHVVLRSIDTARRRW